MNQNYGSESKLEYGNMNPNFKFRDQGQNQIQHCNQSNIGNIASL